MKKVCGILSGILLLCFGIKTAIDYAQYTTTLNSAPFSVWVLVNGLYFIVPAVILLVIGLVYKRKK